MYETFPLHRFPQLSKCLARNGSNFAKNSKAPRKFPLLKSLISSESPLRARPDCTKTSSIQQLFSELPSSNAFHPPTAVLNEYQFFLLM